MIGGGRTPTLSELLREAKTDTEGQAKGGSVASDGGGEQTPLTYSRLFDEYKGAKRTTVNVSLLMFVKLLFSRCGTS